MSVCQIKGVLSVSRDGSSNNQGDDRVDTLTMAVNRSKILGVASRQSTGY